MEPVSYWPVELVLDSSIVYMIINSKNIYEIISLFLALFIHLKRQFTNKSHIKDISSKKSVLFHISILCVAVVLIWLIRTSHWPLPILVSVLVGILYYMGTIDFVKYSDEQFTLFDPKIDIPQTIISGVFSWIAINNHNQISIL